MIWFLGITGTMSFSWCGYSTSGCPMGTSGSPVRDGIPGAGDWPCRASRDGYGSGVLQLCEGLAFPGPRICGYLTRLASFSGARSSLVFRGFGMGVTGVVLGLVCLVPGARPAAAGWGMRPG
jgi:hypothetical protein